jgi:glycine/serine hydroxymethyltransferase
MSAILSTTKAGDTVMTVHPNDGGHFATTGIIKHFGRKHIFAKYNLDKLNFDADETAKIFKKNKAKLFYIDASNYINPHNLKEIRKKLGKEAIIVYDASHTLGLILGGKFQNPFKEGADIITANTHKTFAGPQKGLIIVKNKKLGEKMQSEILGTLYSSNHVANLIALAITILEWEVYGKKYAKNVIENAQALSKEFEKFGFEVRKVNDKTYTQNEQVHLFLKDETQRLKWAENLTKNNISTNLHCSPGKRIFVRIGTQEVTRRGMMPEDMKIIAKLFVDAINGKNVKNKVVNLNKKFSKIKYSFDE